MRIRHEAISVISIIQFFEKCLMLIWSKTPGQVIQLKYKVPELDEKVKPTCKKE
jgi:hypothetical protein